VDVLEEGGPIGIRLEHLGGSLGGASMPSTWRVVVVRNHALNLLLGETTPTDAILAQFIQK